jgi:hypothetical protein
MIPIGGENDASVSAALVMPVLDPMGANIKRLNRSLAQCYPSSHGSTGGSAEPHRAEAAALVTPVLDPMGADIKRLNRSLSQRYPSSHGSTGGSAEPHRAETDGPVEPDHDGGRAFQAGPRVEPEHAGTVPHGQESIFRLVGTKPRNARAFTPEPLHFLGSGNGSDV